MLVFLAVACFLHRIQAACRGFLVSVGELLSFTRGSLVSTVRWLFVRVPWQGPDLLLADGMWVHQPCLLWFCRKFTDGAGNIPECMLVVFYSCPCHLSHPHAEAFECAPRPEATSVTTVQEAIPSFLSFRTLLGQHSPQAERWVALWGEADGQPAVLQGRRTCVLSPPSPSPTAGETCLVMQLLPIHVPV